LQRRKKRAALAGTGPPLWDRADELTKQALQAPVSTTREALTMLWLIIQHQAFERDIDK